MRVRLPEKGADVVGGSLEGAHAARALLGGESSVVCFPKKSLPPIYRITAVWTTPLSEMRGLFGAMARAAGSLLQYGITPAERARMDATMRFYVEK